MTHRVTAENQKIVEAAAGCGLRHEVIGKLIGITEKTLRLKYRDNLDQGTAKAHFNVARATYDAARSGKNPTMTIWFEKTRMGMRETMQITTPPDEPLETTGPDAEELIGAYFERLRRDAAGASTPGGADRADPGPAAKVGTGGRSKARPQGRKTAR